MLNRDVTLAEALAKREHLIALGETTIYTRGESEFPWDSAVSVERSCSHRLNGPIGCYIIAEKDGLTFKLNIEFEARSASGTGYSDFDSQRLRELILKMNPNVRRAFSNMLARAVLPGLQKTTSEIRKAMERQWASEDCVRGLIAFAETPIEANTGD